MYAPRGLASASTTAKNSAIWPPPMAVISEPLGPEQGVSEVGREKNGDRQPDAIVEVHGAPPRRAQKRTYVQEMAKNATAAVTSRRSIMPRCGAWAMPRRLRRARRAGG